jgi:hypothetical protein
MALKEIGPTASQAVIPPESSNKTTSKHQHNADLSSPLGDEDTNRLQQNNPRLQQYPDLPPASQPLRGRSAPEITLGIQDLTLRDFLALPPSCNYHPCSDPQNQTLKTRFNPTTRHYTLYMQGRNALQTFYLAQAKLTRLQDSLDRHEIPQKFRLKPIQGIFKTKQETTLHLFALKNQYQQATLTTVINHHRTTAQEAATDFEVAWTHCSKLRYADHIKLMWTAVYRRSRERAAKKAAKPKPSDPKASSDLARMQGSTTSPQGSLPKNNICKPRAKPARLQPTRGGSPSPGRSNKLN